MTPRVQLDSKNVIPERNVSQYYVILSLPPVTRNNSQLVVRRERLLYIQDNIQEAFEKTQKSRTSLFIH